MLLWLRSTIAAHPFITQSYWFESAAMVRDTFLPQAMTWVACNPENGEISGFISVISEQFIGALFVRDTFHGCGVAQQLMATAKAVHDKLLLEVYQQNHRAVAFYQKEGFTITADTCHPGTGLQTWIMGWKI
ncbi:N-acetyltransferase [Rouxiella sp. WC2420]